MAKKKNSGKTKDTGSPETKDNNANGNDTTPRPSAYSRFGNWVGSHRGLATGLVTLAIGGVLGYFAFRGNGREIIYNKTMDDGRQIRYVEDVEDRECGMRVQYGGDYVDYFTKDCTSIDWLAEKSPNYSNDKLTKINGKIDGKEFVFEIDDINENTLKGKRAKERFEAGEKDFNERRKKIREELRKDYVEESASLGEFYSGASVSGPTSPTPPSPPGTTND